MNRSIKTQQTKFSHVERYALVWLFLAFLALLLSGCDDIQDEGNESTAPSDNESVSVLKVSAGKSSKKTGDVAAHNLNDDLFLGEAIVVKNVTAWPVYSRTEHPLHEEFVTLDQAQKDKNCIIREMGAVANATNLTNQNDISPQQENWVPEQQGDQVQGNRQQQSEPAGGTVNTLMIENKGNVAILILAGTLVKGGKQDRQIAQDFIVPAGKSVPVGAFCVEHGRWNAQRKGKSTSGLFQAQQSLAVKSVRDSAQFKGDQQAVWANVAICNQQLGKSPKSGTLLASVEETDKKALVRRTHLSKELTQTMEKLNAGGKRPVGLAYAVDGKVLMVRTFSHPKILIIHQEALINTIAMEGEMAQRKALAKKVKIYEGTAKGKDVVDLVKASDNEKEKIVDTAAGNRNGFKKNKKVWNGNVYYEDKKGNTYSPSQNWTLSE